jgi:O-antigen ligase
VEKWSYHGSMTGGFVNRNSFATFLASGAAIGLASIVVRSLTQSQKPTSSFLFLDMTSLLSALGWLVIFAALARTNSRMGLFVGLLGLGILSMYFVSKSASSRFGRVFRFASAAVLLVGLVTLIVTFYGLSTLERLGSTESSVDVRTQLYEQVWGMIMQRPLTGYGGGTFETSYPLFHQLPVSVDLVWDKAHNTYLALLVDYGLIFGSLPILVVLLMVLKILTMLWRSEKPDFIILSTVVVVCIASVHALFDFSFEIQGYALLFTAVLATGVSRMYTDTKRPVRHSR